MKKKTDKGTLMKCLLPVMLSCGFLLTGCNQTSDETDGLSQAPVVASDDVGQVNEKPRPVTVGPRPKVAVEQTEYDFGRMALGTKSKTEFEIRNDGESDLKLLAGKPTCQCTLFSLSTDTVAPGETATLTVSWDAKIIDRTFQHGGPVFTNDPDREVVQFVVMGQVGIEFQLQPSETWNAGEVTENKAATVKGMLFSAVNADFEIERIEAEGDEITTEFRKLKASELTDDDGLAGYEIQVTVSPEMAPGEMVQPLQIFLKGHEKPLTTSVTARRIGPIRVLPTPGVAYTDEREWLRMGEFPADQGKDVDVMLLVDDLDQPLQLTEVTAVPPFVKVKLKPIGTNHRRYLLTVSVPAGIQKGVRAIAHPVQILMETNHPKQKRININVTYRAS